MLESLETGLAVVTNLIFQALKLLGGILALAAVGVVTVGTLRSIWSVTVGRATLILPFLRSELAGVWVSGLLAQELNAIERKWRELKNEIDDRRKDAESADTAVLLDLGRSRATEEPMNQSKVHKLLFQNSPTDEIIAPSPQEGQAIGPISFGAASFSPESIFAFFDLVRSKLALRTISGQVDKTGNCLRINAVYSEWGHTKGSVTRSCNPEVPDRILNLISDVAFQISKARLNWKGETETWATYRTFLEGYVDHLRFISTGDPTERTSAINKYRTVIQQEPEYHLASYNLGSLLYSCYTAAANAEAIEYFRVASESSNEVLKALALSGSTRAYFQEVHRFGHEAEKEAFGLKAEHESKLAVEKKPELEETQLAKAFALQLRGQYEEAIAVYKNVVDLPGKSHQEKSFKSMALNNMGYITMTQMPNELEEAKKHFDKSLEMNNRNKMSRANLAEYYKREGDFDQSREEFDRALELDPSYVNAYNEKGMLYVEMASHAAKSNSPIEEEVAGNIKSGLELHCRALSLIPSEQALHRATVRKRFIGALLKHGFTKEAESLQESSETRDTGDLALVV